MAILASAPSLNGVRKAAVLLVLLGEEAATAIYRHLSEPQVQRLTREIAELSRIDPQLAAAILEEYYRLSLTQEYLTQGGEAYARALLMKAFGEEGAKGLMEQVERAQQLSDSQLDSLEKTDPQQLARFLEGEHPQTIALILAHLAARPASALLMRLPEQVRAESVKRLALLRDFSPEMAQKVSLVLHRKLLALGEQSRRAYAGFKGVAEMLNRLEPNTVKAILETIESEDAKLALNIRNLMFTFDDLLSVPETGIRELTARLEKKVLALALKGASEEVRDHLLKTMSSRAVEMLKEDMEALGPVRARDIAKAQQEAIAVARKLEEEGKMVLKPESADEYVL
jgi:flagellar motor switch protein FliG